MLSAGHGSQRGWGGGRGGGGSRGRGGGGRLRGAGLFRRGLFGRGRGRRRLQRAQPQRQQPQLRAAHGAHRLWVRGPGRRRRAARAGTQLAAAGRRAPVRARGLPSRRPGQWRRRPGAVPCGAGRRERAVHSRSRGARGVAGAGRAARAAPLDHGRAGLGPARGLQRLGWRGGRAGRWRRRSRAGRLRGGGQQHPGGVPAQRVLPYRRLVGYGPVRLAARDVHVTAVRVGSRGGGRRAGPPRRQQPARCGAAQGLGRRRQRGWRQSLQQRRQCGRGRLGRGRAAQQRHGQRPATRDAGAPKGAGQLA
jgi:hypothetical protein